MVPVHKVSQLNTTTDEQVVCMLRKIGTLSNLLGYLIDVYYTYIRDSR